MSEDTSAPGAGATTSYREETRILDARVGRVVGLDAVGGLQVDFAGNRLGPLTARTSLSLDEEQLRRAIRERQSAVLLFENGDPALPIVIGLLHASSETPLLDAVLEQSLAGLPRHVQVDGQQVLIEGREQLVLKCGKATLTLRSDGMVVLRGVNIRTEADEVQRIRGGKVQIN